MVSIALLMIKDCLAFCFINIDKTAIIPKVAAKTFCTIKLLGNDVYAINATTNPNKMLLPKINLLFLDLSLLLYNNIWITTAVIVKTIYNIFKIPNAIIYSPLTDFQCVPSIISMPKSVNIFFISSKLSSLHLTAHTPK